MTTLLARPLVSIGMPVYNEERFIDESLSALRAQDYPNIEIVISDNASTDGTLAICQRHAAEDARIRVESTENNRGALENFQHVLQRAGGTYFMWASGHDLWSPNLISECVALLEQTSSACIAFPSSNWVGPEGEALDMSSGWTDTRGLDPIARFFTILWGNMHPVLGVMRIDHLLACAPMPAIAGGDLVLLSKLALRGDFVHASKASWSRREFRSETSYDDKIKRYKTAQVGIVRSRWGRAFPLLALPVALTRSVFESDLSISRKVMMLLALVPSLALRYVVGRHKPIR